jgi:hypothetical protein
VGTCSQHRLDPIHVPLSESGQREPLLRIPSGLSPAWLPIDPTFAPLRGRPRFEKLARGA